AGREGVGSFSPQQLMPGPGKAQARAKQQRLGEAAKMPFPIHPHMLRHACGFKLANESPRAHAAASPPPDRADAAWPPAARQGFQEALMKIETEKSPRRANAAHDPFRSLLAVSLSGRAMCSRPRAA